MFKISIINEHYGWLMCTISNDKNEIKIDFSDEIDPFHDMEKLLRSIRNDEFPAKIEIDEENKAKRISVTKVSSAKIALEIKYLSQGYITKKIGFKSELIGPIRPEVKGKASFKATISKEELIDAFKIAIEKLLADSEIERDWPMESNLFKAGWANI
jgi:hypothetical protein